MHTAREPDVGPVQDCHLLLVLHLGANGSDDMAKVNHGPHAPGLPKGILHTCLEPRLGKAPGRRLLERVVSKVPKGNCSKQQAVSVSEMAATRKGTLPAIPAFAVDNRGHALRTHIHSRMWTREWGHVQSMGFGLEMSLLGLEYSVLTESSH